MAAPTFVQAGAGNTDASGVWATGGLADLFPAPMTVGNVIVLQVVQDGTTSGAVTYNPGGNVENLAGTDSEMDYLGEFPVGSPTAAIQHLWIGRNVGAGTTISGSGANSTSEDVYYRFYEFTDVSEGTTLAEVIENSTAGNAVNGAGTGTAVTDTGVTTTGADRLALQFVAVDDDNSLDAFTSMTGGTWAEAVAEYAEASGTDGALQLQTATIASAGTINGGSLTMGASDNWGVVGFAFLPASSFATHTGSAAVPLTLARQVAGFATKAGLSAVPLSAGIATKGFKTTASGISVPLSLSIATAGARTVSGSSSTPLSVSISTAGIATHLASAAVPLSLSVATAGFKTTTSSAAVPLTLNRQVSGFKTTASSAAVPLTISIATAGAKTVFGSSAVPLTLSISTAGIATHLARSAVPLSLSVATAGFATKSGATAVPLVFTSFVDGSVQGQLTGSASVPLVFGAATTGFKSTTSSLAVPLALAIGTAGFKTTTSSLAVPLVIGIATAGDVEVDGDTTPFRSLLGVGT